MRTILEPDAIRCYEAAGDIVKKAGSTIRPFIKKDEKLIDIAERVEGLIVEEGGRPAFPCTVCMNNIASHYTPLKDDESALKTGDLLKLDLGASVDGYIADTAFTMEVGANSQAGLIAVAEKALAAGVGHVKPGVPLCQIGRAIDEAASHEGFHVLKDLLGHSLDRYRLHGGLTIPNYDNGSDLKIREGDVLAIEPFVTRGSGLIRKENGGNIYQLVRNDEIYVHRPGEKKLLKFIAEHYGNFPFAARWLPGEEAIGDLLDAGCVKGFSIMVEADGVPVAQAESTVIVESNGCRVIT
jgi:methionyl aminopeptidase